MKELTRTDMAAVKRIAANTKSLRNKIEKLDAKIAELKASRSEYVNEIAMWEAPIVSKYGYTVEEILDGSYLDQNDAEATVETVAIDEVYPENPFDDCDNN